MFATPDSDLAFNVRLEMRDWMAFHFWTHRKAVIVAAIAMPLGALWWIFVAPPFHEDPQAGLITALCLLGVAFYPAHLVWIAAMNAREPLMTRPVTYECNASGFRVRAHNETAQYAWSDLREAAETRRYFFLFLTRRAALILPKDSVGDAGAVALLRERSKAREQVLI